MSATLVWVFQIQTGEQAMSTYLLYHGFGICEASFERMEEIDERLVLFSRFSGRLRCPCCGSEAVIRKGAKVREIRCGLLLLKPVSLSVEFPRIQCHACGAIRQVRMPFCDEKKHYTKGFEQLVKVLAKFATIADVAACLRISWNTVKEIVKNDLQARFSKPDLKGLKQIAIDEICIGKGHKYLTIVLDLISGAVVFVGKGKGCNSLIPFWKRVKKAKAEIEVVAMDMSVAFALAVKQNLPRAYIVNDRFHIVKLLNEKLSELRRKMYHEATTIQQKKVLKGTRWLLLKNPENLDPTRDEEKHLKEALKLNAPLATAYYMKDSLRQFWQQPDIMAARAFLDSWTDQAMSTGIKVLMDFAKTLMAHRLRMLAWYDYPISTGPLEGINNKIKTMQRQAYGFKDRVFFELKIYALHESRYALVG